jgi:hypothetical protein
MPAALTAGMRNKKAADHSAWMINGPYDYLLNSAIY